MPVQTESAPPGTPTARHGPNPAGGRDFVIGDLHGELDTLEEALRALEFDARDRLFTIGDLIDRGLRSADALGWLEAGRFTGGVRGNHEQMMAYALAAGESVNMRLSGPGRLWLENGGDWWYDSAQVAQARNEGVDGRRWAHAERALATLGTLPYIATIEYAHRHVGLVHAPGALNCATPWPELVQSALDIAAHPDPCGSEVFQLSYPLLWPDANSAYEARDHHALEPAIAGVDLVITGHSPALHPRWTRHNVLCIDTGVHYEEWGHLTVAEVHHGVRLHRFARVKH